MNKSELIDAIAASADIPKAAAGRALDAVIESVTGALKAGDSVVLVGFGTFSVTDRPARTGRNPQTGKALVDLKQANADQLRAFGLADNQIELSPYSTVLHNTDYFSHRLEQGITGRMMAVIGLR